MYRRTTLANGVRIVTSEIPTARSVSISFFLNVGSRHEPTEVQGISHFIEHMLFKGTESRPTPKEIAQAIEGVGGIFNAEAGKEITVFWDKVAVRHWKLGLEVLVDLIRGSLFVPEEIEKERRVIVEELSMLVDSPGEWVHVLSDEAMWGDEPLGRDVGGNRESIERITREDLLSWFHRYYGPANLVISVAGSIDHETVCAEVETLMGSWSGGTPTEWALAKTGPVSRVRMKSKKTEQAHLCLAVPGLSYVDDGRFALDLLNIMLGEGMSSRLFLEIRERQGLAYDVHSYINYHRDGGSVVVYAGVDPKQIDRTLKSILGQINQLTEMVDEDELQRAKEFWKGRMQLRLEDTRAIASWLGAQELLLDRIYTVDDIIADIDRVTLDEVRTLGRQVFRPEAYSLAVIGPYRDEKRFLRQLPA